VVVTKIAPVIEASEIDMDELDAPTEHIRRFTCWYC
jgi:hypothetical protein